MGAAAATPPENIPLGPQPPACAVETSTECEDWTIERLDAARSEEGLPAYALPADFTSLPGGEQLLILTDLDRLAHGYTPVYGLNANLSEAAQAGVSENRDPTTPSAGGPWKGYGSDWASTAALTGYYLWMYDDGYESPNGDCNTPSAPGCWGHRKVILGEAVNLPDPQLMGAATGSTARNAGTALIVSANDTTTSYYTWTQAQQEGAGGSSEEHPAGPGETPAGERSTGAPTGASTASAGSAGSSPNPSGTTPDSEVLAAGSPPSALIVGLLGERLVPSGPAARTAGILRRGRITFMLPAGLRGTLAVDYYLRSTRRLLVAKGKRRLSGRRERVAVTLTGAGRHLLRHRGRVALVVYARLLPAGGRAIRVSRSVLLTR
jgi:hypothetical protein